MLASVGINGAIVNNVNANATLLSDRNVDGLGRLADAMRPYGVHLGISLNLASPNATLATYDPLDPKVDAWWANITDQIYKKVGLNSILGDESSIDKFRSRTWRAILSKRTARASQVRSRTTVLLQTAPTCSLEQSDRTVAW